MLHFSLSWFEFRSSILAPKSQSSINIPIDLTKNYELRTQANINIMSFTEEISSQFDLSFDGWTSFDGVDGEKLWYIHLTMRTSEFLLRNFLEQAKSEISVPIAMLVGLFLIALNAFILSIKNVVVSRDTNIILTTIPIWQRKPQWKSSLLKFYECIGQP